MIPRGENAGYEDTNDAERLADDPTMRVIVGRRGGPERPAASINTMSRFETEVLTQDDNVEGLGLVNATWVDRAMRFHPTGRGHEDDEDCQYGKSRFIRRHYRYVWHGGTLRNVRTTRNLRIYY